MTTSMMVERIASPSGMTHSARQRGLDRRTACGRTVAPWEGWGRTRRPVDCTQCVQKEGTA